MANTYSKNDKTKLTENFSISEFHCHGKDCSCSQTLHDPLLSAYLQQIRDYFGKPITITSGFRCPCHNKAVGGASGSRHTKGEAADFVVQGIAPDKVAKFAESIGIKGIGLYADFVHIDTRTTKSYWYGHSQEPRDTFLDSKKDEPIYIVTCRVGDGGVCHSLIFDSKLGSYTQRVSCTDSAISMTVKEDQVSFSPIVIANVSVEIMQIRKLEQ